ncbi:MAG: FtsX-like permease family protein [Jatrophihabitantaceae bacterium]
MHRLRLLLRGLWWRRGLTAAVLAVAVVTTTAAALGPLYARAAAESILQDHLTQAGSTAGLSVHADLDIGNPTAYRHYAAAVPKPGAIRGYDSVIAGLYTSEGVAASLSAGSPPLGSVQTSLVWRDGQCRHLVIVTGRCPRAPDEVIASQRTISSGYYQWKLGTTLYLGVVTESDDPLYTTPIPTPHPVKIVGSYRPISASDPYWFQQPYFDTHVSPNAPPTVDALFAARNEFGSFKPNTYVQADFDYPLTAAKIRLDDVASERATVRHLLATHTGLSVIQARSDLLGVLAAAAHERHLVDIGTLLVTLQLALLAWLVLFQIVSDAVEARGNEIAMAKLRGLPPGSTVRFGLGEPVVLLAAAVPLGLLAAWGVTHLFAASILVAGVPVVLTWSAALTASVAFAGGLVAAGLAGYRTLTRSVLDQWRRTTRRPGQGPLTLLADVVLAAGAITGVVLLRGERSAGTVNDTAALLAPGLLVFAVALVGVRLLPLACRRLARITRGSRRIGLFLAARQVARRPVGLRLAAFLAFAVGLATFAVAGETVASANRAARAEAELGADRVAAVQFAQGLDPVAATRRADPAGRWAMAAATWLPDGGDSVTGTVLGIDSSRLDAVGSPVAGGPTRAALAALVGATTVAPITLTAPRMRVHLSASRLTGDVPPDVQVNFRTPRNPYLNAEGGPIRDGAHDYVVPLSCASGCTLRGLTWDRPITAQKPLGGTITLTGLDVGTGSTWTPLDLGLHARQSWYAAVPQGQASDRVSVTPAGVRDVFGNQDGGFGGIAYAADPTPMPAVATLPAIATGSTVPPVLQMSDSTQTVATFAVVRYVRVLPSVLDDGVVLDVRFLQDELPGFGSEANWQVWLGPEAPPDALSRLAAAGLQVEAVSSQSARVSVLGRQAPALALLLLLACAIAGAVLAVGGTAISISASSRRRSYEIAALRAVGVSRGSLLRAGVAEQLLLLGTAVVLGVPTGVFAVLLAMPAIPEFADHTPITLHYTPQLLPTALFAGAFVVLLVATAVVAGRVLVRAAVPDRLREAA